MPSKDKAKIKAYKAKHYAETKVAMLTQQAEYRRQHPRTAKQKADKMVNSRNMIAKYPEKYKARYMLRNAVRLGKVIKGCCEVCGSPIVESHHDDYSKPLEVRWLCRLHHRELEGRWIPKGNLGG